ncbi:putative AC transposase [Fusarium oxysporum f. sp. rapae]|uniref:Putative AC transposase n=1 Tax=Fusarium oxysporum f. sp. rapae TaxID=485398 RepID=A0A8J5NJN6_FUSOX|nr:putative AC transposase [Fusarium oxysporum f. sp. rapae]
MPFSQDSLSLTVPTTPSTPNLSLPAPSVASSAPPSIASIPTEKLSIWTFFRYARGSEPGFRPKERSDRSGKSSNKRLHYCIACWDKKKSWSTIYTSGARDHLRLNHPSLWKRWLDMQDRQTSSKPKLMPGQQVMNSFLLQKDEASRELVLREAYDRPRHLQALLTLCARRKLPLNAIEWPELHDLLLSANPEISDLAQFSRRTFTRALVLNYERYRQILQNNIQEAIGDVHISTDMWTSPARKAYLCICVRWISQDYQFKHGMLALPQVLFSHSVEIQAAIILRTLKSFGITTKLGYHTGDNATSNGTLLIELSRSLRLEFGIDYDPTTHRIRCLDHILNLALQAFLLATSKEALKAALAAIEETEDTDPYELFSAYLDVPVVEDNPASIRAHEQAQRRGGKVKAKHKGFEGWGATTALQKLHNLAVWLRNSSIHHDRWIEAVGITLGIDNDTRWSSWYHLIKRTTRKEREIKDFIDKHPECDNFRLNGVEWDTLKRTERFLSVFASAIRPGSSIELHFRRQHQLKGQVLKDIKDYYSTLELADPKLAATPEDGSQAIDQLTISHGYSCNACHYLTTAKDNIVRHWREAGHGAEEERWTEVLLQTWIGGKHARYWIVQDDSDSNGPSNTANTANTANAADAADATSRSAMDKLVASSQAQLEEEDAARLRKGDVKEELDRDSPWVKRLGWVRHFGSRDLINIYDAAQWLRARAATSRSAGRQEDEEAARERLLLSRLGQSFDRESALPDHPTVADLPRAVWRNKRYVLEESLSRKGSKGRKSWIKRHGIFLVEIDTNDSPLSPYWACRLCDAKGQPEFFAAAATSSAADHLRKSHRIFESSQAADPDLSTDESERPKRRRLQYSTVPRARVKTIRELSLGLLINTNVPFSFFSDTFFQQLAWQLDPHLSDQIPWSRQSMGRLLDDTYKSKKDDIKQGALRCPY